jgi:site-specific DNA-methyltransferase (cytosine-N4-specific)
VIYAGDCRKVLPALEGLGAACVVTSPPYWCQRDYGHVNQIGLELSLSDYVDALVSVFSQARKALHSKGALWLNLGDTYHGAGYSNHRVNGAEWSAAMNGDKRRSRQQDLIRANPQLKPKDLAGVPWRVALALQADGWFLRSEVVWSKTRAMPDPARDRPAKSHEHVFFLTASRAVEYWDRSLKLRDVWQIPPASSRRVHYATFPEELAKRCILASCPPGGLVLDPFCGTATVGRVAEGEGRRFVGIDIAGAA